MEFNDDDDESNSNVDTLSANSTCVYGCIRNIPIEDSALQQVGLYMTIVFANAVVSACIGLSGFLLNVINIAVFVKMGFGEFTNVSLLSLAVADAGALLFLSANVILYSPLTPQASDKELMVYLAVTTPHVCFAEISGICTVFLALKRFICIALPHRVKSLMTPKRALTVNLLIFMYITANKLLVYIGYLGYLVTDNGFSMSNETESVFGQTSLFRIFDNVSTLIDTFTQLTTFPAMVFVTGATIHIFNKSVKWRRGVTSPGLGNAISNKEKKLSKMVILISVVYIVCLIPAFLATLVMLWLESFSMTSKYYFMFMVIFSVLFNIDAINSTLPFFIYVHMSSKFRKTLKFWFLQSSSISSFLGERNTNTTKTSQD
ncbi:uncharacterized protein LOC129921935 [Biomphalaria glabrata]|uniref:Uncharacterized protein LOC129921935 n=1 Tax=Biomphalaria glabrata TaxID=6526 RepID=A0A9W2YF41_BIOGL|nr:uncharacterized protein LOC129921935 [Biomphalaria glabrata]